MNPENKRYRIECTLKGDFEIRLHAEGRKQFFVA